MISRNSEWQAYEPRSAEVHSDPHTNQQVRVQSGSARLTKSRVTHIDYIRHDASAAARVPTTVSDSSTILRIIPRISSKLHNENDYPAWVVEASQQLRWQKLLDIVMDSIPSAIAPRYQDKSDKALDYLIDSVEIERYQDTSLRDGSWRLEDPKRHLQRSNPSPYDYFILKPCEKDSTLLDHIDQFSQCGVWKTSLLLATFPRVQPYINIIQNITSTEDKPTYAHCERYHTAEGDLPISGDIACPGLAPVSR